MDEYSYLCRCEGSFTRTEVSLGVSASQTFTWSCRRSLGRELRNLFKIHTFMTWHEYEDIVAPRIYFQRPEISMKPICMKCVSKNGELMSEQEHTPCVIDSPMNQNSYSPVVGSNGYLSSCLIGSPTRSHSRVEDISFPCTSMTNSSDRLFASSSSKAMQMLTTLRLEVKKLKRDKAPVAPVAEKAVIPRIKKVTSRSPARDKLQEIQHLLVDAEGSLASMQSRLESLGAAP